MNEGEDSGREDNLAEQLEAFRELVRQNEQLRSKDVFIQNLGRAALHFIDTTRGGIDWLFDRFSKPASYPMRIGGTYENPLEPDEN